ncbi:MAG: helix-turn-helix transcriptional regulator [Ruminococcaceae bacterium]|nr:helix-turn-helix transcriptional regulator [Oscillospiraceae bacterium]
MVDVDFEFLSVSYVITEILLLLLHGILRDTAPAPLPPADGALPPNLEELFSGFSSKVATLTAAEKRILAYYIEGRETAEIPGLAYVSIHTVKKHNRSIYQKLGVASRDELMLYIELFRRCDRLSELSV